MCPALPSQGKIVKDKRYAVYSPLDGQVCTQQAQHGAAQHGTVLGGNA